MSNNSRNSNFYSFTPPDPTQGAVSPQPVWIASALAKVLRALSCCCHCLRLQDGVGGRKRRGAPQNGSGRDWQGPLHPTCPITPRSNYLYKVEQLHQENCELGLAGGVFWLHQACGEGRAHAEGGGGDITVWDTWHMSLLYITLSGEGALFGQTRPQLSPWGPALEHDAQCHPPAHPCCSL